MISPKYLHKYFLLLLATVMGLSMAVAIPVMAQTQLTAQAKLSLQSTATYRVAKSGDGSDGLSWSTAFTDLQDALAVATDGDEIWVASGVYTPGLSQSDAFTLTAGVQVYGGFAATETLRTERDWEANPTILSGDIGGDDLTDANDVVTATANISGSNSYHVVYADGASGTVITDTTVLDGFTITGGQATGSYPEDRGGGFYCDGYGSGNNCSPTLGNLTFAGNVAGDGGAIYNDATSGGVSSPTLLEVTFSGNTADSSGGAIYNYARNGGVSSPVLTDVIFSANTAADTGGAINNYGDNGISSPVLTDVIFSVNQATHGGAIYSWGRGGDASPVFYNVSFLGNVAEGSGAGALHHVASGGGSSSPRLTNVLFSGNTSAGTGGALRNYSTTSGTSTPSLVNVTMVNNSAQQGGAIYSHNNGGAAIPSLSNVILWGNTATSGPQIFNNNTTSVISYSLVQGGDSGSNTGTAFSDGTGNIDADPLFADALGTDGISGTLDDDLRLSDNSPAIDAGDNDAISEATDLDGNPRYYDDALVADSGNGTPPIVDMGAYERQSGSCAAYSVLYVDRDATGNNDGTAWADAFTDLQDGLALARICAPLEVWVASGVYTPGLSQSDSFTLTSGMALYGGFAATETLRSERDWETNVTVLSGDMDGDDTTDANGIVTDTANISGTNSYHVIWADGVTDPITESTVLDGFTITAGQANGSDGGGFYCDSNGNGSECSPSLSNLTFSGNWADNDGGAMFNYATDNGVSSPGLSNVTFSGNGAGDDAGGMGNEGRNGGVSSPSLSNVTFSGNWADNDGGAMFNYATDNGVSSPGLSSVTFSGNGAGDDAGGMGNEGRNGGVSSPSLSNVTFSGNTTADSGGAMYNYGLNFGVSSPSLHNVTFFGNTTADSGGAVYNYSRDGATSSPSLVNVTFSGNVAADKGGAISNYSITDGDSSPSLVNVAFSGNSANYGGAMASYTANGGASSPSLSNVTFSGNAATAEGGALFNRGLTGGVTSPGLNNVIVWGNTAVTGTQFYNLTATLTINYSLIQSDTTNTIVNDSGGSVIYGPGILTGAPLFVDDDGADGISGTLDDDLHLSDNSPAIDAGDNDAIGETTDLDGNARFYDDTAVTDTGSGSAPIIDMGAYERQSGSWTMLYLPIVARDS